MNRDSKTAPTWSIKTLKSPVDGLKIRYGVREMTGDPVHRILLLNGRSEWIEKYADLPDATRYGENALWVSMDHRGQGASEGKRAHVKSYDDFARDVAAVVTKTFGDKPYIIVAHSMGGLIATYGTLKGILDPKGLVLCAPLFGLLIPMPYRLAKLIALVLTLSPFGGIATGAGVDRRKAFKDNPLTQSKKRFEAMTGGPYQASTPTFAWVHATFLATALIYEKKYLKKLTIPVSLIVGEKEAVVDRLVYQAWIDKREKLTGQATRFKLVPGALHELLNESDKYRKSAISFINQAIKKQV